MKSFSTILLYFWIVVFCVTCTNKENKQGFVRRKSSLKSDIHKTSFPEFKFADSLRDANQTGLAFTSYNSFLKSTSIRKQPAHIAYTYLNLAECSYLQEDWPQTKLYIDSAMRFKKVLQASYSLIYSNLLYLSGKYNFQVDETTQALTDLNSALLIKQEILGKKHPNLFPIYTTIGNVYRYNMGDFIEAERYFNVALEYLNLTKDKKEKDYIQIYYNLATTNRLKGDYEKAIAFAIKAYSIARKSQQKTWIEKLNAVLANIYSNQGRYKKCIYHNLQAIALHKEEGRIENLCTYYINLAEAYREIKSFKLAKYYCEKALHLAKSRLPDIEGDALLILSLVELDLKEYKLAEFYTRKALEIKKRVNGNGFELVRAYKGLGNIYMAMNNFDSALAMYQLTFNAQEPVKHYDKLPYNPDVDLLARYPHLAEACLNKALILSLKYDSTKNLTLLEASLNCYILLDSAFEKLKKAYDDPEIVTLGFNLTIYDNALNCCYKLYKCTGQDKYLEMALQFMEKSKSNLLRKNLSEVEVLTKIDVPERIKSEERNIKYALAFYQNKISVGQSNGLSKNQEFFHHRVLELSEKLDKLKKKISKNFPAYFKIKYSTRLATLSEAINFANKERATVVVFRVTSTEIFIIGIDGNGARFYKFSKDTAFLNNLQDFLYNIKNPGASIYDPTRFEQFMNSSYQLCSDLLSPFLGNKKVHEKLIIIPDKELSEVPFEALQWKRYRSSRINFRDLSYLIKKFDIKYAYSLNLFFNSINVSRQPTTSVSAFSFTLPDQGFNSLEGSGREIQNISKILDGNFFSGRLSTEKNFKLYAPKADIIHLAVHGIPDTVNSLNSSLIFFKDGDPGEDGKLFSYELYQLRLKSPLVVLSSCGTGLGKDIQGEGIMSISRAFSYAGASTVITSLWDLPDQPTTELVGEFYKNLDDNLSSTVALRRAKTQFLESSDELTAHPSSWASLVLYGNLNDFTLSNERFSLKGKWEVFVILLIAALLIGLIKARRRGELK